MKKLPVTIITGFLGAGKTTLVRHLLEHSHGLRLALIVNEFGEFDVDGSLLQGCNSECVEQDCIYTLSNGCLCCTVQEEFVPMMSKLLERREHIDHLLIETSGVALPKPLVQAFKWPQIRNHTTVDAVLCVLDTEAVAHGRLASDPEAFSRQNESLQPDHESNLQELYLDQLTVADVVILNKTDRVPADALQNVEAELRQHLHQGVHVLHARHCKIPQSLILGLDHQVEEHIERRHDHHSEAEDHDHDHFQSVRVSCTDRPVAETLAALRQLFNDYTIYRAKGFFRVPNKPMRLVIQAVGQRIEHYFDRNWRSADEPAYLVLIGHDIDHNAFRKRLHELGLTCS